MAVEDGRMQEFSEKSLQQLISSRQESFAQMMEQITKMDYEIIDLRREAGFTARLALKRPRQEERGIVIICPGGGFLFKSYNEALPVAEYFYQEGMNAAILDYHTDPAGPPGDLMGKLRIAGEDGLAAVRYLRANAEKYRILPDHIAIGGFSAGGMLSGYAATKFDYGAPASEDVPGSVSSRPDAALILYGAFSSTSTIPSAPGGMTREAIAEAAKIDIVRNIRTDSPPMFVFQTHEDDPRIALNFCMELAVHGVPYEIHTFEEGPHGGGLYNGKDDTPDIPHTAMWARLAADWLLHKGY